MFTQSSGLATENTSRPEAKITPFEHGMRHRARQFTYSMVTRKRYVRWPGRVTASESRRRIALTELQEYGILRLVANCCGLRRVCKTVEWWSASISQLMVNSSSQEVLRFMCGTP